VRRDNRTTVDLDRLELALTAHLKVVCIEAIQNLFHILAHH